MTVTEKCPFPQIEEGPGQVFVWYDSFTDKYRVIDVRARGIWGLDASTTAETENVENVWVGQSEPRHKPIGVTLDKALEIARERRDMHEKITCLWLWDGAEWQRIAL